MNSPEYHLQGPMVESSNRHEGRPGLVWQITNLDSGSHFYKKHKFAPFEPYFKHRVFSLPENPSFFSSLLSLSFSFPIPRHCRLHKIAAKENIIDRSVSETRTSNSPSDSHLSSYLCFAIQTVFAFLLFSTCCSFQILIAGSFWRFSVWKLSNQKFNSSVFVTFDVDLIW